ncbi:hypothetical protein LXL04_016997 [Taraxacum kok-saghyz]
MVCHSGLVVGGESERGGTMEKAVEAPIQQASTLYLSDNPNSGSNSDDGAKVVGGYRCKETRRIVYARIKTMTTKHVLLVELFEGTETARKIECGYYVCKFMKEIIHNRLDVLVNDNISKLLICYMQETTIGDGNRVYTDVDLDEIFKDWAYYVTNIVLTNSVGQIKTKLLNCRCLILVLIITNICAIKDVSHSKFVFTTRLRHVCSSIATTQINVEKLKPKEASELFKSELNRPLLEENPNIKKTNA